MKIMEDGKTSFDLTEGEPGKADTPCSAWSAINVEANVLSIMKNIPSPSLDKGVI